MKKLIILLLIYTYAFAGNPMNTKTFIEKTGKEPTQYILDKFKQKNYVVFCEPHKLKHEVEYITSLIPALYKDGVFNLAIEFGNVEDQAKMDELINNSDFNRDLAIEIMRNYTEYGIWGYQEYLDLYKTVWELNKLSNTNKFRIILLGNLNTPIDLPAGTLIIANPSCYKVLNLNQKDFFSIIFHTAVQTDMDSAYNLITNKNPIAIDIAKSPIDLKCDGYIFLKPREDFEPLTWIDNFIDESYMPVVKKYYKNLNIETIDYAIDLCKAHNWMDFELARGVKVN